MRISYRLGVLGLVFVSLSLKGETYQFEPDKLLTPQEASTLPIDPQTTLTAAPVNFYEASAGLQISAPSISDTVGDSIECYLSTSCETPESRAKLKPPPEAKVTSMPIYQREGLPEVGGRRLPTDFSVDMSQFEEPIEYRSGLRSLDMVESSKPEKVELENINWWDVHIENMVPID
jgi:hypothetical protein